MGLFSAHANGGGVAFFAHVGGFTFGLLVTLSGLHRGLFSRNQAYGLSGSAVNFVGSSSAGLLSADGVSQVEVGDHAGNRR